MAENETVEGSVVMQNSNEPTTLDEALDAVIASLEGMPGDEEIGPPDWAATCIQNGLKVKRVENGLLLVSEDTITNCIVLTWQLALLAQQNGWPTHPTKE